MGLSRYIDYFQLNKIKLISPVFDAFGKPDSGIYQSAINLFMVRRIWRMYQYNCKINRVPGKILCAYRSINKNFGTCLNITFKISKQIFLKIMF